ncbi:MAG: hypothetical protein NTW16_04505, partial [Bacteroidetes bacterium]|nr:hypothetical protein [Bacteroidota bacterium]
MNPAIITLPVDNINQTTAFSGGNVVSDGGAAVSSRGVCWSTTSNPTTTDSHTSDGSGTGVFVSNLIGLSPNTTYHLRAYATNNIGTAYGNEVLFTTTFQCGLSLTISHIAGTIAPINKTAVYGTVTDIPGELSKCWITSNLGSDHQAIAVNDTTETSAGWYWQFNRKQGYKHNGISRTPNTAWITAVVENLDWQAINDPCTLELGSSWRIPTRTEWTNTDTIGGWANWNGSWNSGLKLHAAGYLNDNTGVVNSRGSNGFYWSSSQQSSTYGWNLYFYNGFSGMRSTYQKSSGFTLRCLNDANSTLMLPLVITSSVFNIGQTTATCGGNVIADGGSNVLERGVCWNTSPNPITANSKTIDGSGTGVFVSNLIGLNPNTNYFIRAYAKTNNGTAYGIEETFATFPVSECDFPITIYHVAGNVAPVSKTVTYGTTSNIPGEPSKCWITSNLGADHQATSVNDATEASAGWYWQFNRKQGYKHDGTVRTPQTLWEDPIYENSDWSSANDPCVHELGSDWRIPTLTEWGNVNWFGPWSSALKLHAAGCLTYDWLFNDAMLAYRGTSGFFWSNLQDNWFNDISYGLSYSFGRTWSYTNLYIKSDGYSLRCLKETSMTTFWPTVHTTAATNVTQTTASSGGNVTSDGGAAVTSRGICWNTFPNPTIADSHNSEGSGTGEFVSNLTGLIPNTYYYVRAYATNSSGTGYGNEIAILTSAPCGSSITIYHLAGTVAPVDKTTIYGTVTNIPGEPVKCWITRNLGASQQATTIGDNSEPS